MLTKQVFLTEEQFEFVQTDEDFPCFCGGYGSGKTYAGINRAIARKLSYPNLSVAYYLPTFDLVRTIAIPRFSEMLETLNIPYKFNKSAATLWLGGTGLIYFRTMDTPERIVGYEVADSIVDELDTLKPAHASDVWIKVISRNRQSKPDGAKNTVAVATTPEGFRFVYDRWVRNPAPGYRLIKAKTESNKHLPAGYIDRLKASYPPQLLAAYLDGEFVNLTSGNVYHEFDRKFNHAPVAIKPGEVLHVGMDFNVMNMTSIISVIRYDEQSKQECPYTVAEITGVRDTPTMCALLKQRYSDHSIVVYPDASGNSRKSVNAQESDLSILRSFGFTVRVDSTNPAVKDRVLAVNAIMARWKINTDACPRLTESLEQQGYDKNGEPDKSTGHDHACDGAGYFLSHRWPIVKREAIVSSLRI